MYRNIKKLNLALFLVASCLPGYSTMTSYPIVNGEINSDTLKSGIIYYLPKKLVELEITQFTNCTYKSTVEVSEKAIPDTKYSFVLSPTHKIFRDDSYKTTVSAIGLLQTNNIVAADRLSDIITKVAGIIGGIPTVEPDGGGGGVNLRICTPRSFSSTLDPTMKDDLNSFKAALLVRGLHYDVSANLIPTYNMRHASSSKPKNGIFYRQNTPFTITVSPSGNENNFTKHTMLLPQSGPIGFIATKSNAFVTSSNDLVFDDGILTAANSEYPSELLEIVRTPVKALTSFISIPASILKLRVNLDQEKANAVTQKVKTHAVLNCIKVAGDDADSAANCIKD